VQLQLLNEYSLLITHIGRIHSRKMIFSLEKKVFLMFLVLANVGTEKDFIFCSFSLHNRNANAGEYVLVPLLQGTVTSERKSCDTLSSSRPFLLYQICHSILRRLFQFGSSINILTQKYMRRVFLSVFCLFQDLFF
jgi:hypothetical protein